MNTYIYRWFSGEGRGVDVPHLIDAPTIGRARKALVDEEWEGGERFRPLISPIKGPTAHRLSARLAQHRIQYAR